MPNPKKLKEDSVIIVLATLKVEITIMEEVTFGRMCRLIIWKFDTPIVLAAFTYSRSLKLSVSLRIILA